MFMTRRTTMLTALALAFGATAAHATAPRGGDALPAARHADPAPTRVAGRDDEERRRREIENRELTRKLRIEREQREHQRQLEEAEKARRWREIRDGCKYGRGRC